MSNYRDIKKQNTKAELYYATEHNTYYLLLYIFCGLIVSCSLAFEPYDAETVFSAYMTKYRLDTKSQC